MQLARMIGTSIKNALGLPVEYTSEEFREIKKKLNWDNIPDQRLAILADVFSIFTRATASRYWTRFSRRTRRSTSFSTTVCTSTGT